MTLNEMYLALERFATSRGLQLNADREHVIKLLDGLLVNEARYSYRSCPCRLASGEKEHDVDIICPCLYMPPDTQVYGSCYCGLYVTPEWNQPGAKHPKVPERREPLE